MPADHALVDCKTDVGGRSQSRSESRRGVGVGRLSRAEESLLMSGSAGQSEAQWLQRMGVEELRARVVGVAVACPGHRDDHNHGRPREAHSR